jgi:hypothetical protein
MHFRARSYDPRLGRFVQKDLVIDRRPLAHYVYASNAPTQSVDPFGLFDFTLHERLTNEALATEDIPPPVRAWVGAQTMAPDLRGPIHGFWKAGGKWTQDRVNNLMGVPGQRFFPRTGFLDWEELHFDDLPNTAAVQAQWARFENAFRSAVADIRFMVGDRTQRREELATVLGHSLHAVQDFYSHANWIELSMAAGFPGGSIPTWFSAGAGYLDSITADETRPLWTGAFERPPVGGQPHHDQLNKDNASRPNHSEAWSLAKKATQEWYQKFVMLLQSGPVDDFRSFKNLTPAESTDMTKRAGEGSSAAAAVGKAVGILER